jgi:hypothetical protein
VIAFTEDTWTDYSELWKEATDELREWFKGRDVIVLGEFMAFYDKEMKDAVPRRELATYRSKTIPKDQHYCIMVHDLLYLDGENMTAKWYDERYDALKEAFGSRKMERFSLVPSRTVHTVGEFDDARAAMLKVPGSEGIMLKLLSSTYSLGGENDAWAKVKETQVVTVIVHDRHEVKGSPGVYNFSCAIGPVKEPEKWRDTVEIDGKTYAKIGVTGNAKVDAARGDRLRVEVLELYHYEYADGREGVHWFGPPVVIDATDDAPMTIDEFLGLNPQEVDEKAVKRWIAKSGDEPEERYALGVVMEPLAGGGEHDTQRDFYDEKGIWKAFKHWTQKHRRFGLMHKGKLDESAVVLGENYIAPLDISVGGDKVKKGSWLTGAWFNDESIWKDVKSGKLTTWSIGGYGRRIPSHRH